MRDLHIQIVNYKTKNYLIECLKTVFADLEDSSITYSVAVLENGSGEDISDIPTLFPGHEVHIFVSKENLGFGAGHNLLAKNTQADFLFILNPDTKIIEPSTIQRLVGRIRESDVQVIGPRLVTGQGNTQRWDHGELEGLKAWIALQSGNSSWKERKAPTPAAWVSGAAFLIEKEIFDKISGFDENFFLYKEEEELCWRIRENGGRILYDPTISMLHYGGVVAKKSDHMQKSVDYFLSKHFKNRLSYPLLRLLNKILH
jgi:N-acetylglucosaminyl-diphospho-decaprenol L-rhamnosyltransferase